MYGIEQDSAIYQQEPPPDLYVSNTLIYITPNSLIALKGDLVLEKGKILGRGTLLLKNDTPQEITCHQGYIENLSIDNPTKITLDGNLKIGDMLVVKSGIFDISEGKLVINPNNIELLLGGSILKNKSPQFEKGTTTPFLPSNSIVFANIAAYSSESRILRNRTESRRTFFTEKMFGTAALKKSVKPPDTVIV